LTVCGVFVAPDAAIVMVLLYVPADKPELLTEAVIVPLPVPLAGLTDNHAGAVPSAVAVQFRVPPPLFDMAIVWFAGFAPTFALKLRLVGESDIVGDAGALVMVRVTFTVCGVFVAPDAAIVMVLLYVPADKPALLTEAVIVPLPVPLAGLTDNHAGDVLSAVAVQLRVPPPLFDIAIVRLAGFVPTVALKLRLIGESDIVGDEVPLPVTTSTHDKSALGKPLGEAPTNIARCGLLRDWVTPPTDTQDVPFKE
jgi:hypothetical protein